MTKVLRAASRRRKLNIRVHRWHRRIGVCASLFLIWMAVSGWLLNHTQSLNLARNAVHSPWVLQRYGLWVELPARAWITAGHWLVATQDVTVLDGKPLAPPSLAALGMVESETLLFVADANQLVIFTADGALVDTVPASLLPVAKIAQIGNGCAGVVIAGENKLFTSSDGAHWQPCVGDVQWAASAPLTTAQKVIIEPLIQPGISIERLLLDLHSGRFLGSWGPYFVDALGGGLVVLAVSGLWMFSQQRRRQLQRSHHG